MDGLVKVWLFDPVIGKIVVAVLGFLVIHAIFRFLRRSVVRKVRDSDNRYRVRKIVSFIGYLVGFFFLTAVFKDQLGGLTVMFGVAGAGIAFALQEVIVSVAGWVAVSFSHFYKPGDRIQLGGIRGDVIDIGVLRTTLMECGQWVNGDLYNGRIVRVANSFVFKEPVFNYSADFPFLWDEVAVPVRYGSDARLAREILEGAVRDLTDGYVGEAKETWKQVVEKYRIEDARIEPMVTMTADENWMTFTVRYIVDYRRRRVTKDLLFTRILEAFEQTGGRVAVACASAEIRLLETSRVDVHLAGNGNL